ncbi:MAG: hypothetical protein Q8R40_05840 [bacterium]|nr:hypothetical protein [bacterium]
MSMYITCNFCGMSPLPGVDACMDHIDPEISRLSIQIKATEKQLANCSMYKHQEVFHILELDNHRLTLLNSYKESAPDIRFLGL